MGGVFISKGCDTVTINSQAREEAIPCLTALGFKSKESGLRCKLATSVYFKANYLTSELSLAV